MKRTSKIKLLLLSLAVVSSLFAISSSAFADDALPTAGEAMGTTGGKDNVVYAKESVYDFDGDDVEGTIVRPDEANITGEEHGKTGSLIKMRPNFVPELIRSVDSI